MNHDKAREFFSAYYEGALEAGLRQSFENRLRTDATLQADYAAFIETMGELEALRLEPIELPDDLSRQITTRIEAAGVRRNGPFALAGWTRGLSLTAVAAVAIFGAVYSITVRSGGIAQGSLAGGSDAATDQLQFKYAGGKLVVNYQPSSAKTLVVTSGDTGKEIRRFTLDGQRIESPLENPGPNAALFELQVLGEHTQASVAVPGSTRVEKRVGNGTVKEFSEALASFYRVPVVLQVADPDKAVSWKFSDTDPREAASDAVGPLGYSVDRRSSELITVLDR